MQGELADTGAHVLSQADVNNSSEPSAPSLGAERSFNQALNASNGPTPTHTVNPVDVSNEIHNFQFPRIGKISETSLNTFSMKDLDHTDWDTKQLINSVRPVDDNGMSMAGKSLDYIQKLESQNRTSMEEVLNVDKHMKPLMDLVETTTEKINSQSNISLSDMTPQERMHQYESSIRENTMDSMALQSAATKVQSDIGAASIKANLMFAAFSAAKEVSVGLVGLVKNIINNTR